jgi:hypothetical protein
MNTNNEKQIVKSEAPIVESEPPRRHNIFDSIALNLSDEDKKNLAKTIIEKRIELDYKQIEAEDKNRNSNKDIEQSIRYMQELEQTKETEVNYKTEIVGASGKTTIEIKKSKSILQRIFGI